jgi:hypothetical protein
MQPKIQRCLDIMLHMPCQMQEMHKGKLYICYKGDPTHQLKKSNTHQAPPRKRVKVSGYRGLVKNWLVGHVWVYAMPNAGNA